ncbi:MAG: MoxR family ATPase [Rhodocyclaceae bacterium]|nr:MoxR family ATPase [Rhodocyclaceae bacterium]
MNLSSDVPSPVKLPAQGSWPEAVHEFDSQSWWAIKAAVAAQRPLLVRGEPGTGKSQLARAAAVVLERAFVSEVVHARSESQDLQWRFDAVARLADAQAIGAARNVDEARDKLAPANFLSPGALWWAFDWNGAEQQAKTCKSSVGRFIPDSWTPEQGCVLLIDEIDKAEADLPNGLLETLGNGGFSVPWLENAVGHDPAQETPLVIITTNEERELPAAFVRRCLVLNLSLPKDENEFKERLVARGELHFQGKCAEDVRREAARQLWEDRVKALEQALPPPGQAEYLDMLRVLSRLAETPEGQLEVLKEIAPFALSKHVGLDA